MTEFCDADWVEVGELGGGLPDAALDEIKPLVQLYHDGGDRDFEVRSRTTKPDVKRAFELTEGLSSVLGTLVQDNNYRCFNTGGNPVSVAALEQVRNDLGALHSTLSQARVRFERRSTRDWWLKREKILVRRLLEIQQRYLKTDLPLNVRERPGGLRFRQYLEKCTGLSGPSLNSVLEKVIGEFAPRKKTTRRRTSTLVKARQEKITEL
jgi:hypothetical protein